MFPLRFFYSTHYYCFYISRYRWKFLQPMRRFNRIPIFIITQRQNRKTTHVVKKSLILCFFFCSQIQQYAQRQENLTNLFVFLLHDFCIKFPLLLSNSLAHECLEILNNILSVCVAKRLLYKKLNVCVCVRVGLYRTRLCVWVSVSFNFIRVSVNAMRDENLAVWPQKDFFLSYYESKHNVVHKTRLNNKKRFPSSRTSIMQGT